MPLYYFNLRNGREPLKDPDGVDFEDLALAYSYGCTVVTELMLHAERQRRHWLLEICNEEGAVFCELPFAVHDRTLDKLPANVRRNVERRCRLSRELSEAIFDAQTTVLRSRAIRARAQGKPYLVADDGRRL